MTTSSQSKYEFDVPDPKKLRLIISTDTKCEADDQYAIVHALLTPRFRIKGIVASHFGTWGSDRSMEESYEEVQRVVSLMGMQDQVDVYRGATKALEDEVSPLVSEGSEMIVREAMTDDPDSLFVICIGPLTDMASAYLQEPRIADRVNVIWIGGGAWPEGEFEFNLSNDIHGANVVFSSDLSLWQVPKNVYTMMRIGLAELQDKVAPCGKIGEYLFKQLVEFNDSFGDVAVWPPGESWSLGDSPTIGLLLDPHEYCYELKPAPRFAEDMRYVHDQDARPIRVYDSVDSRFVLEDFFSKLRLNFGRE